MKVSPVLDVFAVASSAEEGFMGLAVEVAVAAAKKVVVSKWSGFSHLYAFPTKKFAT